MMITWKNKHNYKIYKKYTYFVVVVVVFVFVVFVVVVVYPLITRCRMDLDVYTRSINQPVELHHVHANTWLHKHLFA